MTGKLGQGIVASINYWLNLFTFAQTAIVDWWHISGYANYAVRRAIITQIIFTGVNALPLIILLAALTAGGLTVQIMTLSSELSRELNIPALISHLMVFEIAPLMTAMILISRSGSAIVVDIGNMKLRGEIEGLIHLGVDIDDYIVAPRLIAGMICQLMLAIYFALIALYGGAIFAGLFVDNAHLSNLNSFFHALPLSTLGLFVLKNLCFGWLICATACYHALQIEDQVTQLPQQTQSVIVRATTHVFLLNGLFMVVV